MAWTLKTRRESIGISCFSVDNANRILWAHYARSSRGLCLEVESDSDARCFQQVDPVQYVNTLPRLKFLAHRGGDIRTMYTTKGIEWAQQKEIRAFQHVYGKHPMDPRSLQNVFFGSEAPSDDVKAVCHIIRREYPANVGIFTMVRTDSGIDFQRIER